MDNGNRKTESLIQKIKVCSLNCRGLTAKEKKLNVYNFLRQNKINIACLQETYCTNKSVRSFNHHFNNEIIHHSLSDSCHSRGVSILINKKFPFTITSVYDKGDGRSILINGKIDNELVTVVNMYAPNNNNERNEYFDNISNWIIDNSEEESSNVVICGDLNTVADTIDRLNGNLDFTSNKFIEFCNRLKVIDSFRNNNEDTKQFSYNHPTNTKQNRLHSYF